MFTPEPLALRSRFVRAALRGPNLLLGGEPWRAPRASRGSLQGALKTTSSEQ